MIVGLPNFRVGNYLFKSETRVRLKTEHVPYLNEEPE